MVLNLPPPSEDTKRRGCHLRPKWAVSPAPDRTLKFQIVPQAAEEAIMCFWLSLRFAVRCYRKQLMFTIAFMVARSGGIVCFSAGANGAALSWSIRYLTP